jgi:hypothetical protein
MSKASARIIADHDRDRVLARWESLYRALARPAGSQDPRSRPAEERVKVSDGQP